MANQASCFGMQIQWEIQTLRIWPLHITETSLLVPAVFGIWVLTTVEGLSRFLPSCSAFPPQTAGTLRGYQDTMSLEMVRVTGCVGVGCRFSLPTSLIWLRGAWQPRSFWVELGLQPELLNCPRLSARSVQRVHLCPLPFSSTESLPTGGVHRGWWRLGTQVGRAYTRGEKRCGDFPSPVTNMQGHASLHCHNLLENINVILGCGFPSKPNFADSQTLGSHSSFIPILNH